MNTTDKYGEFADKCGSCGYLNLKEYRGHKYYCEKDYTYYEIAKLKCHNYIAAEDFIPEDKRDYYDIKKANRGDCYITTVLCEILGFDDHCEILNIMREFRRSVLQRDLRYLGLMMEYDDIGPVIAESLCNDENALWIAKELLEHYLKPIIKFINAKNYDAAIVLYYNMTNILKENYQIIDNNERKFVYSIIYIVFQSGSIHFWWRVGYDFGHRKRTRA